MIPTLKSYGTLIGAFFLFAFFVFLYVLGFRKGAEKWKERAKEQKAKADAIKQEQKNAKEAKAEADEYKAEQNKKADEDIDENGYTPTLDDDINDWP